MRPSAEVKFGRATQEQVEQLLENCQRGHFAGFVALELADILRQSAQGFLLFARY